MYKIKIKESKKKQRSTLPTHLSVAKLKAKKRLLLLLLPSLSLSLYLSSTQMKIPLSFSSSYSYFSWLFSCKIQRTLIQGKQLSLFSTIVRIESDPQNTPFIRIELLILFKESVFISSSFVLLFLVGS